MNKITRIIFGSILIVCGIGTVVFSGYQVLQGELLWFLVAIAGGVLAMGDVRIAAGDKLRDILEDLLFVLMRTH